MSEGGGQRVTMPLFIYPESCQIALCYNSGRSCPIAHDGAWCNGSTPDFESVDPGSNPGAPAE